MTDIFIAGGRALLGGDVKEASLSIAGNEIRSLDASQKPTAL